MIRCLILTGGLVPPEYIIRGAVEGSSMVIAADSGFDTALSYGITPDYVTGDMDSVLGRDELAAFDRERIFTHPGYKDETDTELALDLAWERGAGHVTILGGGGGRLDHLLGIAGLFERDTCPDEWYTDRDHLVAIGSSLELEGLEGRRVSFFPAGRETCTMTSEGLEWPLDGLSWKKGDAGISNIITGEKMRVSMKTGRLIMVIDLELEKG